LAAYLLLEAIESRRPDYSTEGKDRLMDTPVAERPKAELRDYLAEERTFLAWIRTGLTLMGFGFVVARFGLFLQVMQITQGGTAPLHHGLSPWIGTTFIVVGVAVNLFSIRRHMQLVAELNRGQLTNRGPSREAIVLALFLALIGFMMAIYLALT
jgi:putative membrane protein